MVSGGFLKGAVKVSSAFCTSSLRLFFGGSVRMCARDSVWVAQGSWKGASSTQVL